MLTVVEVVCPSEHTVVVYFCVISHVLLLANHASLDVHGQSSFTIYNNVICEYLITLWHGNLFLKCEISNLKETKSK